MSVLVDTAVTQSWTRVASAPSPLSSEIFAAIKRVSAEFWPGIPVIPTMMAGATDGSFLRNVGIPVYGTSGLAGDIDDVRAHGKDESVLVKSFYEGQEYFYRLVKVLSAGKQHVSWLLVGPMSVIKVSWSSVQIGAKRIRTRQQAGYLRG